MTGSHHGLQNELEGGQRQKGKKRERKVLSVGMKKKGELGAGCSVECM